MKTQINWIILALSVLISSNSRPAEPAAPAPTAPTKWPDGFSLVRIPSSLDESFQAAYFLASQPGVLNPLVVSLHTWSGDYSQSDPLAEMVKNEGWNYIHPDFRGRNSSKDACLSKKAISDIDDSIQYAINKGFVDPENIFIVGVSGGGYATLGMYLKTSHSIKAFLAWAAISDLSAWFYQSKVRYPEYAQDILRRTSDGINLDENEARRRSPLFWEMPAKPKGRLEIFEGIKDGYTGSCHRSLENQPVGVDSKPATLR
jgi:pimeloyl-ACP methyl ester carboxylesterase